MSGLGTFCGIGVGPGERGLISVAAWEFLQTCEVIFTPRAKSMGYSVARRCLPENRIPEERFREVEFAMESDRAALGSRYAEAAEAMAVELEAGRDVAWLTIGDPSTYSTYLYALRALRERLPGLTWRTWPGVTSYGALAAASGFSLGEGKERVLVLPCPEETAVLQKAIEEHEVVVLMKIGARLPAVLALLEEMGIAAYCVFGGHIGMEDAVVRVGLGGMLAEEGSGYLSTILIRKQRIGIKR